jgi:hypothetical protein
MSIVVSDSGVQVIVITATILYSDQEFKQPVGLPGTQQSAGIRSKKESGWQYYTVEYGIVLCSGSIA